METRKNNYNDILGSIPSEEFIDERQQICKLQSDRPHAFVSSKVWGSLLWMVLHTGTLTYPKVPNYKEKDDRLKFLQSFHSMIPCIICKKHASLYITNNAHLIEKSVQSSYELFTFFWIFHNAVNARILTKINVSFSDAIDLWKNDNENIVNDILSSYEGSKLSIRENSKKVNRWKAVWFILHYSALNYPVKPTDEDKLTMKKFISVMYLLFEPFDDIINISHLNAFIKSNTQNDQIVSSSYFLFSFYWKLHNFVNTNLSKNEMSFDDAINFWMRGDPRKNLL